MRAILCDLYLGNKEDASNRALLAEHQITHVVNCAAALPCFFPEELCYLSLEMEDPDESFLSWVPIANAFIDQARGTGRVLVHCRKGLSRSPSIILAYLGHMGFRFDQALEHLLARAVIGPHSYFLDRLQETMRPSRYPRRISKLLRRITKDK